jgi:hypothetical protein
MDFRFTNMGSANFRRCWNVWSNSTHRPKQLRAWPPPARRMTWISDFELMPQCEKNIFSAPHLSLTAPYSYFSRVDPSSQSIGISLCRLQPKQLALLVPFSIPRHHLRSWCIVQNNSEREQPPARRMTRISDFELKPQCKNIKSIFSAPHLSLTAPYF